MFKKVLLIFFVLLLDLSAVEQSSYTFIVDNPTMVDAYFNIFNSMAGMFNSSSYLELLKLVFLMGGFITFAIVVIKSFSDENSLMKNFPRYMFIGTTLLIVLFSNKTDLIVKTNKIPSFCSSSQYVANTTGTVISNMPMVLTWFFSAVNTFSIDITRLTTTAFSDVHTYPITTSRSDYVYYLSNIKALLNMKLEKITSNSQYTSDSTIADDFTSLVNNCIIIPASSDGIYGQKILNTFYNTGDFNETLDQYINNGKLVIYKNALNADVISIEEGVTVNGSHPGNLFLLNNGQTYICGAYWSDLKIRLNNLKATEAIECSSTLADSLDGNTLAIMTGMSMNSTTNFLGYAKTLALNSALINSYSNAMSREVASEMKYAAGKSISELSYSSIGQGFFMAEMLPFLQMGLRAILYAFFPFVFIVVLLPGGMRVLLAYVKTILWVELWGPAMAVLNMFMATITQNKFSEVFTERGMNAINGTMIYNDTYMLAGVAGYLFAFIPPLTWLILEGSADMINNITSGMALRMSINMDSDQINRDVRDQLKTESINDSNRQNQKEAISLAEVENKEAKMAGIEKAGDWISKDRNINFIKDANQGNETSLLITGAGKEKVLMNSENFENIKNLTTMNTLIKAKESELLNLDNNDSMEKISSVMAIDQSNKLMTNLKSQNIEKNKYGITDNAELVDKVSSVQGLDEAGKIVNQDTRQNLLANSTNKSKEDAGVEFGKIEGTTKSMKELSENLFQIKAGNDGDSSNPLAKKDYNKIIDRVSEVNATESDIKIKTSEKVFDSLTVDQLSDSKSMSSISEIGTNLALEKKADIAVDSNKNETGINNKGKNLYETSKNLALYGVKAGSATKAAADNRLDLLYSSKYGTESTLLKNELGNVHAEISGGNAIQDSFNNLKGKFIDLNNNKIIGGKDSNDRIMRAIGGKFKKDVLQTSPIAYRALTEKFKTDNIVNTYNVDPTEKGTTSAYKDAVTMNVNKINKNLYSGEYMNKAVNALVDNIADNPINKFIGDKLGLDLNGLRNDIKDKTGISNNGAAINATVNVGVEVIRIASVIASVITSLVGDSLDSNNRRKMKEAKEQKAKLKVELVTKDNLIKEKIKISKEFKSNSQELYSKLTKKIKEIDLENKVLNEKIKKLENIKFFTTIEEKVFNENSRKGMEKSIKLRNEKIANFKNELRDSKINMKMAMFSNIDNVIMKNDHDINVLKDKIALNSNKISIDKNGKVTVVKLKGNFFEQYKEAVNQDHNNKVNEMKKVIHGGDVKEINKSLKIKDIEMELIKHNPLLTDQQKKIETEKLKAIKVELKADKLKALHVNTVKLVDELSTTSKAYKFAGKLGGTALLTYNVVNGVEALRSEQLKENIIGAFIDKDKNGDINVVGSMINTTSTGVMLLARFNPYGLAAMTLVGAVGYLHDAYKEEGAVNLNMFKRAGTDLGGDFTEASRIIGTGLTIVGQSTGVLHSGDYSKVKESRDISKDMSNMIKNVENKELGVIGSMKIAGEEGYSVSINRSGSNNYTVDIISRTGEKIDSFQSSSLNDKSFSKDGFINDIKNNIDHAKNFNSSIKDVNGANTASDFKTQLDGAFKNAQVTSDYGSTTLGKINEKINELF